jgi:hypothetical protein
VAAASEGCVSRDRSMRNRPVGASKDTTRGRFKRYQPEGFRLGS